MCIRDRRQIVRDLLESGELPPQERKYSIYGPSQVDVYKRQDITVDDLRDQEDAIYLAQYDAFYEFTSDFGPGSDVYKRQQQRRLLVERVAAVGAEHRRDAKAAIFDEGKRRGRCV